MATSSVGQAKSRPNTPSNEGGDTGGVLLSPELVSVGLNASYQIEGLLEVLLELLEKLAPSDSDADSCCGDACRGIAMRIRTLNDALMAILGDDLARSDPRSIARDVIGPRALRKLFADIPRSGAAGADHE